MRLSCSKHVRRRLARNYSASDANCVRLVVACARCQTALCAINSLARVLAGVAEHRSGDHASMVTIPNHGLRAGFP
jgi:hypothetical protein